MFKRIFWINLGLLIIIFLLSLNVYKVWNSIIRKEWLNSFSVSAQNIIEEEILFDDEEPQLAPLYTYDLIADKNLFRPERAEWFPPAPDEDEEEKNEKSTKTKRTKNKTAMKEPILYGIIITSNKKSAMMKGSIRGEPQKITRKKRMKDGSVIDVPVREVAGKITPGKVKTYHVGDEINESIVLDILPDRVVLSKNNEEYEIILRDSARLLAKNVDPKNKNSNKDGSKDNQGGLQPAPPPGGYPNFPRFPAYPVPVYPQFGPQGGAPFGYPTAPPGQNAPGSGQPQLPRPTYGYRPPVPVVPQQLRNNPFYRPPMYPGVNRQ